MALLFVTLSLLAVRQTSAQPDRGDYTATIGRILGENGSVEGVAPAQAFDLGSAYLYRGTLFLDLAEFQASISASYYTRRKEYVASGTSPLTAYYVARYTAEAGDAQEALPLFEHVSVPDLAERVSIWTGAAYWKAGQKERARSQWSGVNHRIDAATAVDWALSQLSAGRPYEALTCQFGDVRVIMLRCDLLQAVQSSDWSNARTLQNELLNLADLADASATLQENVIIPFYDVSTLRVLGLADLQASIAAFERVSESRRKQEADFLALRAAYLAGDFEKARALAGQTSHPLAGIYEGLLQFHEGNTEEGMRRANEVSKKNFSAALLWAESAAGIPAFENEVNALLLDEHRKDGRSASNALPEEAASFLARAALRNGKTSWADSIVRRGHQTADGTSIERINPSFLTLMAHVRFATQQPRYLQQVLGALQSIQSVYPVARMTLDLAQRDYTWMVQGPEGVLRPNAGN